MESKKSMKRTRCASKRREGKTNKVVPKTTTGDFVSNITVAGKPSHVRTRELAIFYYQRTANCENSAKLMAGVIARCKEKGDELMQKASIAEQNYLERQNYPNNFPSSFPVAHKVLRESAALHYKTATFYENYAKSIAADIVLAKKKGDEFMAEADAEEREYLERNRNRIVRTKH